MKVEWSKENNRFVIDEFTASRMRKIYPFFDKEIFKMELWYLANPRKRKKNHYRFIVNWLNRTAEKEGTQVSSKNYRYYDDDFKKKMDEAKDQAAPPPDAWKFLMEQLRRGKDEVI